VWRPRVFQKRGLLSLDAPELAPRFAADRPGDVGRDGAEFGRCEQTEARAIVRRHHCQAGPEQLPGAFPDVSMLHGDFRPEEESIEDFPETLDEWRGHKRTDPAA
jgi:hypothetical protein